MEELEGLKTPVILIVFNRPELTRRVFARVAEAKPKRLLIIADGPRAGREGEPERCAEVRAIVSAVDWPCRVERNYADANLGCRRRVISGLDWAFEQVDEAIILEDDVLPDPTFFPYCEQMLDRYRAEDRVAMVTGFNIGADVAEAPHSYYFSALTHIWGWATWRRAWQHYDERMTAWPEVRRAGALEEVFREPSALRYWTPILEGMYRGTGPNTWDYQWMFANIASGRLSVTPAVNLVENIGFGAEATHVTDPKGAPCVRVGRMQFPLRHPEEVEPARELDRIDQRASQWHTPPIPKRALRKVRRVLFG